MEHYIALALGTFVPVCLAWLSLQIARSVFDRDFRIATIIVEEMMTISALVTFILMIFVWTSYFSR